jgi:hypothetical protein
MRYREFAIQEMGSRGVASTTPSKPFNWNEPVIPALGDLYTYKELAIDMGFLAADVIAAIGASGPAAPVVGTAVAVGKTAMIIAKVADRAGIIKKAYNFLKLLVPNPKDIWKGIKNIAKMSDEAVSALHINNWGNLGAQVLLQILATIGITATLSKISDVLDNVVWGSDDDSEPITGKQGQQNQRNAVRNFDTPGNPSPALHPELYPK